MKILRAAAIAALTLSFVLPCLAQLHPPAQSRDAGVPAPSAVFNIVHSYGNWRGRAALLVEDANLSGGDAAERMAIIPNTTLQDGTIEVDLTGDTAPNAAANLRGFVGIAFRVASDASHFECFYLRPKNGHSADPVQHGHAAQYVSRPGYDWDRLRSQFPGKYESAADIAPGEWIHVKIQFSGSAARLYINGSTQPTLIVNDLKQAPSPGSVALWIGPGTIAHFANLNVHP